ncbi:MAG: HEAT repeat domain-containing protein [Myxococcota bacterium]
MFECLDRMNAIIRQGDFPHLQALSPGLRAARQNALESQAPGPFLPELRALYAWRDGGADLLPGNRWYSLKNALQRAQTLQLEYAALPLFRQGDSADLVIYLDGKDQRSAIARVVDGSTKGVLEYESLTHLMAVVADGYSRGGFFLRGGVLDVMPMTVKASWMRHASAGMQQAIEGAWTRLQLEAEEIERRESIQGRVQLIDKLTLSCDPRALPILRRQLEFRSPEVKAAAIRALGTLRDRGAKERIQVALTDGHDAIRRNAAYAMTLLVERGDEHLLESLIFLLDDRLSEVRCRAAESLGLLGIPNAGPALTPRLDDEDTAVRIEVVRALGRLAQKDAADAIRETMDASLESDPLSAALRDACSQALQALRTP